MSPRSSQEKRREEEDYATENLPLEPKGKLKNKTNMNENGKSRQT